MGYTFKDNAGNRLTGYEDGYIDITPKGGSTFMTDIISIIKMLEKHGYFEGENIGEEKNI